MARALDACATVPGSSELRSRGPRNRRPRCASAAHLASPALIRPRASTAGARGPAPRPPRRQGGAMTKNASTAADAALIAMIPELVGFSPQDSLVLVVFSGPRSCGAYRVNLPDPDQPEHYRHYATTLVGMLCRVRGADGVLPIVYTDDAYDSCGGIPRATLAARILERARSAGFRIADALCVASDGWGSYLGTQRRRDGAELDQAILARRAEPGARQIAATPDAEAALPAVASHCASETLDALAAVTAQELRECSSVDLAESVLRPRSRVSAHTAALLALVAESPADRDVLLYTWAWGPDAGRKAEALNTRLLGAEITGQTLECLSEGERELALALGGRSSLPRPDVGRVLQASAALKTAAALAPEELRCPLLTMLAWLHWALGRGSVAGAFLERARALDAGYPLAALLSRLVDAGSIPEWAYSESSCVLSRR